MRMPARNYKPGQSYRFGFNGKEMDNEVSGNGNQYDYGFRIYNPRLGKFLSVDPLTKSYPMLNTVSIFQVILLFKQLILTDWKQYFLSQIMAKKVPCRKLNQKLCQLMARQIHFIDQLSVTHEFNGVQTQTSILDNGPRRPAVAAILSGPRGARAGGISEAIPGASGDPNAVLNSFSNFVNDRMNITDESRRSWTMTDGYGKAFRHQVWQGVLTNLFGEDFCKRFG